VNKIAKIGCLTYVLAFAGYSLIYPLMSLAMAEETFSGRVDPTQHALSTFSAQGSILIGQTKSDPSLPPVKIYPIGKKFSFPFIKGDIVEQYSACNCLFFHSPFIHYKFSLAVYTANG
jgi:hypothetical protein